MSSAYYLTSYCHYNTARRTLQVRQPRSDRAGAEWPEKELWNSSPANLLPWSRFSILDLYMQREREHFTTNHGTTSTKRNLPRNHHYYVGVYSISYQDLKAATNPILGDNNVCSTNPLNESFLNIEGAWLSPTLGNCLLAGFLIKVPLTPWAYSTLVVDYV